MTELAVYWLRPVPDEDLSGPYTAAEARERLEAGAVMWPEQALIVETGGALARYIGMCRPSDVEGLAARFEFIADLASMHGAPPVDPFVLDLARDGEPEQFWTVRYTPDGWILTAGGDTGDA